MFPEFYPVQESAEKRAYYVYDNDYHQYQAEILAIDDDADLCLMHVWGLFSKPLKISRKAPKNGHRVFNMAAPGGQFSRRSFPLFEGFYSGDIYHSRFKDKSVYTIPVMPGSSGSPIMNEKGALIGIVSAGNVRFHHIMLGTLHSDTVNFIVYNINKDIITREGPRRNYKGPNFKFD